MPTAFTRVGDELFFVADDGSRGRELWITDGTTTGTRFVHDIRAGTAGSDPLHLTALNSRLIFTADNGVNGREVWTSDGTSPGTAMLKDISPGRAPSIYPFLGVEFAVVQAGSGDHALFAADDGQRGVEPWVTDGTPGGTRLLQDLIAGPGGSFSRNFGRAGAELTFWTWGGAGDTLVGVPLPAIEAPLVDPYGYGCPGANGLIPLVSTSGLPEIGNSSFALDLAQARPTTTAILAVHVAPASLPLGNGCVLYLAPNFIPVATPTNRTGQASVPIPIPTNVSLIGATAFAQFAAVDPKGAYQNLFAFSQGLHLVIGR